MLPRLLSLTFLRFLAAVWVVWFHLDSRLHFPVAGRLHELLGNGAHAMSLFFVLSGLVLTYGYHDLQGGRPAWRFYLARFARLYPAYAAVNLLALIWFTPAQAGWMPWLYANTLSALTLQAWVPHVLPLGIISGTWTISAEFFFYALFPLLLPVLGTLRRTQGTFRVGLLLVLASTLAGLSDFVFADSGAYMYYVMPLTRLPEFALGIVAGLVLVEPARPRFNPGLSVVLATGGLLLAVTSPHLNFGGLWIRANGIIVPLMAWLLYSAVRAEQQYLQTRRPLPLRLLGYLGESSYCLFLGHLILLSAIDSANGVAWVSKLHHQGLTLELGLVLFTCSLALAIALHELVEKPIRRLILCRWGDGAKVA